MVIYDSRLELRHLAISLNLNTKIRNLEAHYNYYNYLIIYYNYSKTGFPHNWSLALEQLSKNLALNGEMAFPLISENAIFLTHLVSASELLEYGR